MSETVKRDYRDTLNLPKTVFPMKAELPKREPDRVAWWKERGTYERRLERNAGNGVWAGNRDRSAAQQCLFWPRQRL